ncbi:MAG: DUF456 family protein [Phycisphaerae bacterium]|nr:DUF456 family protein [Phycisphaerae bacterium]
MTWIQIILAITLVIISFAGVLVQIAGLPGTWLILLLAVGTTATETLLPLGSAPLFSWWTLLALALLTVAAEVVEFLAAAAGAKTGGASKRGMTGAVVGGLIGAIVGTLTILIPVVGSVLGAGIGAALGAITGELSVGGKQLRDTMKPAAGAVAGRIAGTLAKAAFAVAMWIWLAIAAFT